MNVNLPTEALLRRIEALRIKVRRAGLENMIHDSIGGSVSAPELAEQLECEFYSDYFVLAVIHAQANPMHRHTVWTQTMPEPPKPAPPQGGALVYYSDAAWDTAAEVLEAALAPQNHFELFRADRDIGVLVNPKTQFISEGRMADGSYYAELVSRLEAALLHLDERLDFKSSATVSALHRERISLREMYLEAKNTYDYSWNLTGAIHTYPELCASPVSPEEQKEISALEQEFMGDINHLLFFEASLVLDRILQKQFYHAVPLGEITVAVTARLRNVFAVLEFSVGMDQATALEMEELIAKVAQSVSVPELQDRIHDFFAGIADFSPRQPMKKGAQILEYIESNFKNPALSAQMICDRFRISQTYLSKLIKRETGQGLVDRIHDIRVQHAKSLLAETSLTVEQVALQVGFSNRYGLIRAFRSIEGISPSEYRKGRLMN